MQERIENLKQNLIALTAEEHWLDASVSLLVREGYLPYLIELIHLQDGEITRPALTLIAGYLRASLGLPPTQKTAAALFTMLRGVKEELTHMLQEEWSQVHHDDNADYEDFYDEDFDLHEQYHH